MINNDAAFKSFIGTGLAFPFNLQNGKLKIHTGVDLIRSSINIIVQWSEPRRFFLYDFWVPIEKALQEQDFIVANSLVEEYIKAAITKYEPRVNLIHVKAIRDGLSYDKLKVEIKYAIKQSNLTDSYVVPFYKESKF